MTTEIELLELIAELEGSVVIECRAAVFRMELHDERIAKRREVHAAIRALAGEVERLKVKVLNDACDVLALRAEVERLRLDAISALGQAQTALEERDAL